MPPSAHVFRLPDDRCCWSSVGRLVLQRDLEYCRAILDIDAFVAGVNMACRIASMLSP
jgi:hypothetical protein